MNQPTGVNTNRAHTLTGDKLRYYIQFTNETVHEAVDGGSFDSIEMAQRFATRMYTPAEMFRIFHIVAVTEFVADTGHVVFFDT